MTTEEQHQNIDTQESNGVDDDPDFENHNDSIQTSQPAARRSRFFRSKRKQRLNQDSSNLLDSSNEVSNESTASSESPEKPDESLSSEDPPTTELEPAPAPAPESESEDKPDSSTDLRRKFKTVWRSSSPPPPPSSIDDSDDSCSSTSVDEPKFDLQPSPKTEEVVEKKPVNHSKPPAPTIFGGYQRKKSQSVKLTCINLTDTGPKKAVRFADDFGLDLSQVKVIKSDELPHVPSAAFKDLHINPDDESGGTSFYEERSKIITYLEQQFENPIHTHGFDDRVLRHKIVLEQANAIDNRIYGTIKILSFGMNKHVKVHLTADNWMTSSDFDATYITNSYDGTFDRFSFTLELDRDRICLGNNIQFCLCYETFVGQDYWDSNYQQNYRFNCVSRNIPDYSS